MWLMYLVPPSVSIDCGSTRVRGVSCFCLQVAVQKIPATARIMSLHRRRILFGVRIRMNAELETLYHSPNIIKTIKSQRLRWTGHVQRSPNSRLINMVWNQNPTGTRPLGRPRLRWRDNIIKDLQTMNVNNWREAMMDRDQWRQIVFAARTHPGL